MTEYPDLNDQLSLILDELSLATRQASELPAELGTPIVELVMSARLAVAKADQKLANVQALRNWGREGR